MISESLNFEHIHLLTVDSTNRFAFELVSKTNPTDGFCVFSDVQTAGRGQYGREWHSESGVNILASFVFRTEFIPLEEIFVLHQLASLSVLAVLDSFGLSNSQIKWPNDIIIFDKKIAGILIQNSLRAHQLQYSVLGIGLNVNQAEFKNLENACSMKSISHQEFEVKKILAALHHELMSKFEALKNGMVDSWLEKYNKSLFGVGSFKLFQNPDGKLFNGRIISVNKFGEIILENEKVQKNYDFGSIKMIWPQGSGHILDS